MLEPFTYPFVQRAIVEILLLAIVAGALGTWIVLRGLAFSTHAVATAAFPGLVLADGIGFAAALGAFGSAIAFALGVGRLATRRSRAYDSLTALALVAALAIGVVLASDVFHSGSQVQTLLFGSLLAISAGDVWFAAATAAIAISASLVLGPRWLAVGFDRDGARAAGVRASLHDLALLALVALAAVAALAAVGALLATALLVVPAVTARMWTRRISSWQLATAALAAVEGIAGIWLSVETNAPPGATIATLAGAVFAVSALASLAPRLRTA